MGSLNLWVCVILVMFMFAMSSESRPLEYHFLERKNLTRRALRELFEKSKRLKVGFKDEVDVVSGPYDSKRQSPGGPDPHHHSKNLC
ncbi:hypothetical protein FH972_014706 [Carpinus fangiana]|uniref:Cathepsin propeptide inhibitor domain-containing protein n=1 Tax=Carpinus fangiana TaxID=176857 RepID=A0A5N6RAT8_9ROSI|nr:hypothetical protein FH972_014706 [Carpinus fangiana]